MSIKLQQHNQIIIITKLSKLINNSVIKMKKTIITTLITLLLLFSGLAAGGRTKLHHMSMESSANSADGICSLMVETQGYACEEHQV